MFPFLRGVVVVGSTVKEVCRHEELEGDFRWDGELRDLCGAVGVLDLVGEVHANLLEHVGRYLTKVHLVRLVLTELSRSGEHCLYGTGGERVVALHNELVAV